MGIDEIESFLELLARHLIEFVNRSTVAYFELTAPGRRVPRRKNSFPRSSDSLNSSSYAIMIHGAHGVDARFHFVVISFGSDQILADHHIRFVRHQFFRLCVQFRHAGLAQIIAIRVIARLLDLALAAPSALILNLIEHLSFASHRFIQLNGSRTRLAPFGFEQRLVLR